MAFQGGLAVHARNRRATTLRLVLLVLSAGFVLAKDIQAVAQTAADQPPTLAEIAKANDLAWAAIKSVDMEYVLTFKCVENGKTKLETRSTAHWSKAGNLERLRQYPNSMEVGCPDKAQYRGHSESEDIFLDGKTVRCLKDSNAKNSDKGELACLDQKGFQGEIRPETPGMLVTQEKAPELLRYLRWTIRSSDGNTANGPPLMLSEIISSDKWNVSLKEKQTTSVGDTLWLIHAEHPRLAGSYIDVHVNANKGFLIQKAIFCVNIGKSDAGQRLFMRYSEEVEEFQDCGQGVHLPKQVKYHIVDPAQQLDSEDGCFVICAATKLTANSPLPADTFDFRFPENVVVEQTLSEDEPVRYLVWGPDNKPAKEFNTAEEFSKYAEKEDFERLTRRVEKNIASKQPADLVERGLYHLQTKKYDTAITAFSEAISLDPKIDDALFWRGMAYLFYKQDCAKAVADFTECLHHAPEQDNLAMCHYLRGLAYANQADGLERACADMTELLRLDPCVQDCMAGAYLVRSVGQTRKGNLDEALADATKAIEVDCANTNADAHAVRCYVYEKKGDQEKAMADREASKRLRGETHDFNDMEVDFTVALHHCLTQLVPALQ
jgi:Flp pilus assembly protein TadD